MTICEFRKKNQHNANARNDFTQNFTFFKRKISDSPLIPARNPKKTLAWVRPFHSPRTCRNDDSFTNGSNSHRALQKLQPSKERNETERPGTRGSTVGFVPTKTAILGQNNQRRYQWIANRKSSLTKFSEAWNHPIVTRRNPGAGEDGVDAEALLAAKQSIAARL